MLPTVKHITWLVAVLGTAWPALALAADERPNLMLILSDDQSWWHTSWAGDPTARTPAFDRIAREGVVFDHAFAAAPQCAPSRASILSGRAFWQLEHGAVQRSHFPAKFFCYTDLLREAGYHVGYLGKGWGPGRAGDRKGNAAGARYPSFQAFLRARKPGQPFCFWFGSSQPHRPYDKASIERENIDPAAVKVPAFLPDAPAVRLELSHCIAEVNRFDHQVANHLEQIEEAGLAENTLLIVTSDHGMAFPRAKCNLYDAGVRVPLAVRWPARVPAGRVVDDFIALTDIAATFLEAAGEPVPPYMTASSFLNVLTSKASGRVDPARDHVVLGRERHSVTRPDRGGYPIRSIRTAEYLYLRNFRPDRGPTGTPPGTADVDNSVTRDYMLAHRDNPAVAPLFQLAFGMRPAEELYDLRTDPDQLDNVADDPAYAPIKAKLAGRVNDYLQRTKDPRVMGDGDVFDRYPFWLRPGEN